MSAHDPFRSQSATATLDPPAAIVGDATHTVRVPKGSVAKVVEWIDNGRSAQVRRDRAAAALEVEQAKAKPRAGVVSHASTVIDLAVR